MHVYGHRWSEKRRRSWWWHALLPMRVKSRVFKLFLITFVAYSGNAVGNWSYSNRATQRNHLCDIYRMSQKSWLLQQLRTGYHMCCREHSDASHWLLSIGGGHCMVLVSVRDRTTNLSSSQAYLPTCNHISLTCLEGNVTVPFVT